ncbi:MAG: hypothetical protein JWN78_1957 [Bacteroidota bacterium]|nr:hypothetical protein [Bacteroidota bacterium]
MRLQIFKFSNSQILFFFLSFTFISCQHNKKAEAIKDASPYFTYFIGDKNEGVFRGVDFNVSPDELKSKEKSKLYESTTDHLFYEFSYPKDSTPFAEYANVEYFFDENNKLDIITTDIYLSDSLQEEKLKNSLIQYYNERYGKSEMDDYAYDVWKGTFKDKKSGEKQKYTVALKPLENDNGVTLEYVRE